MCINVTINPEANVSTNKSQMEKSVKYNFQKSLILTEAMDILGVGAANY